MRLKIMSAAAAASLALVMSVGPAQAVRLRAARHHALHGKIVSIDSATQFTISHEKKMIQITVGTHTHVRSNHAAATLSVLKVGDRVVVEPSARHPERIDDLGPSHGHKKKK